MMDAQSQAFAELMAALHAAGRHDRVVHPDCEACAPAIAARRLARRQHDELMARHDELMARVERTISPERQRFNRAFGAR